MKIQCLHCGELFDPLQAEANAVMHYILTVLRGLEPHARLVTEYVECFAYPVGRIV